MRPRKFSGENVIGTRHGVTRVLASMRPRKFSGENFLARSSAINPPRFNEAPQIQRGKLAFVVLQEPRELASMRPRKFSGENVTQTLL